MKNLNEFWTIVIDDAELQWHMFAIQSKGYCFLSANTKLVSVEKAVILSNKILAESFRDASLATLRRRHGDSVKSTVASFRTTEVQVDDLLVQARIMEGVFAPNKRPTSFPTDNQRLSLKNTKKDTLR